MEVEHDDDDDDCTLLVIDLGVDEDTIATGDVVAKSVDCEGLGISVFLGSQVLWSNGQSLLSVRASVSVSRP